MGRSVSARRRQFKIGGVWIPPSGLLGLCVRFCVWNISTLPSVASQCFSQWFHSGYTKRRGCAKFPPIDTNGSKPSPGCRSTWNLAASKDLQEQPGEGLLVMMRNSDEHGK